MTQRLDYEKVSPGGIAALGGVYGYIVKSGLDEVLVDLVYLRASQLNGCAFCIDMHTRDLVKHGVSIEKIALVPVWRDAGALFNERERAALAWTESVTRLDGAGVPDEDFGDAIEVFSEKELSDLTIAIGLMNAYNRLGISFRSTPQAVLANQR